MMRGLSLTRPWPYAFTHLGKPVENRSRRDGRCPAIVKYRGELALHAAQSWDGDVMDGLYWSGLLDEETAAKMSHKEQHPAGVIVATCRAVGHLEPWECASCGGSTSRDWERCQQCTGTLDEEVVNSLDLRWWFGGYALIVADVVELAEPVPCKGALGVWRVPDDVERRVRQLRSPAAASRRLVCRPRAPFDRDNPQHKGRLWAHPNAKEVRQEDGYPHGDLVDYECPNCGFQFTKELPQ